MIGLALALATLFFLFASGTGNNRAFTVARLFRQIRLQLIGQCAVNPTGHMFSGNVNAVIAIKPVNLGHGRQNHITDQFLRGHATTSGIIYDTKALGSTSGQEWLQISH